MPRCPDCRKFVSLKFNAYANSQPICSAAGFWMSTILQTVCPRCGRVIAYSHFTLTGDSHLDLHKEHVLSPRTWTVQPMEREERKKRRYRKIYGIMARVEVVCSCGARDILTYSDEVPASEMEVWLW